MVPRLSEGRAVLADLAMLGPAFALGTGPDTEPGWRPLAALCDDPTLLRAEVDALRDRWAGPVVEDRVAASVIYQGLAARLVAPMFGAAVLHRRILLLPPDALHWRPWHGGVVPLWIDEPSLGPFDLDGLHAALIEPLAALGEALRARTRVAPRLLWGDATAAVGGVLRVLSRERPAAVAHGAELARELLGRPPLAGTGAVVTTDAGYSVARRTCCLVYRLPDAVTCSDCVFGAGLARAASPVSEPDRRRVHRQDR